MRCVLNIFSSNNYRTDFDILLIFDRCPHHEITKFHSKACNKSGKSFLFSEMYKTTSQNKFKDTVNLIKHVEDCNIFILKLRMLISLYMVILI